MNDLAEYIISELSLSRERVKNINAFAEAYRLKPYIQILKSNPEVFNNLKQKQIFPYLEQENIKIYSEIINKLDAVRRLRNNIFHFSGIICTKISGALQLIDIYNNIKEILGYMTGLDLDYILGDIAGCEENRFIDLYNKFSFIHNIDGRIAETAVK